MSHSHVIEWRSRNVFMKITFQFPSEELAQRMMLRSVFSSFCTKGSLGPVEMTRSISPVRSLASNVFASGTTMNSRTSM